MKKLKYYEVDLFLRSGYKVDYEPVATVMLKSIVQVAKFLETVDLEWLHVSIYTPKKNLLDAEDILKIWRS